jgi:hypothetical protein
MDPRIIREHLAEAERHIALSSKHISRQIEIIDELERDGHPTALAVDLLATYLLLHAAQVSHLDTIRKELEQ